MVDYRWYLALLALGAIGCSDSSTAPDRLRDLMLGGEVTIRSRTYLIDSVQVDLNDRYVGYLGAEDSGRTTLTVVFAKESGGEEHARIGPGILELSARVEPHDFYFLSLHGFPRYPPVSEYYSDDASYVTVVDRMTHELLGTRRLEPKVVVLDRPGALKWTLTVDSNGVVR